MLFTVSYCCISEFIKKALPHNVKLLRNNEDWETFKRLDNNKVNAVLFSGHPDSISPLYKHVSMKYLY